MARKRHTAEDIIAKLRQVEVLCGQGRPITDAIRVIGVTVTVPLRVVRSTTNEWTC